MPHAINFEALCGANVVTLPPKFNLAVGVVEGAALGVREHLVRLRDLLELRLSCFPPCLIYYHVYYSVYYRVYYSVYFTTMLTALLSVTLTTVFTVLLC